MTNGVDYGTINVSRKRFSDKMLDDKKLSRRFRKREDALYIQG